MGFRAAKGAGIWVGCRVSPQGPSLTYPCLGGRWSVLSESQPMNSWGGVFRGLPDQCSKWGDGVGVGDSFEAQRGPVEPKVGLSPWGSQAGSQAQTPPLPAWYSGPPALPAAVRALEGPLGDWPEPHCSLGQMVSGHRPVFQAWLSASHNCLGLTHPHGEDPHSLGAMLSPTF